MNDILRNLDLIQLAIVSVLTITYLIAGKQNASLSITALIVVVFDVFMALSVPWILQIGDKELVRFIWYVMYSAIDGVVVWLIYLAHSKQNITLGSVAMRSAIGFCAIGLLQIVMYVDVRYFQSDIMRTIYSYGVPSINIAVRGGIMLALVMSVFQKKGEEREGISS